MSAVATMASIETIERDLQRILARQAETNQGLNLLLDALNTLNTRIGVLEEELTKPIGPSEAAETLKKLVGAVETLSERIGELIDLEDTTEFVDADADGMP